MNDTFITTDDNGLTLIIKNMTRDLGYPIHEYFYPDLGVTEHYEMFQKHREYGPAIEYTDPYELDCFFIEGKDITKKVYSLMDNGFIGKDWRKWGTTDRAIFKLKFL